MSQKDRPGGHYTKTALCELLGISRNGYYKHEESETEFGMEGLYRVLEAWSMADESLKARGKSATILQSDDYHFVLIPKYDENLPVHSIIIPAN